MFLSSSKTTILIALQNEQGSTRMEQKIFATEREGPYLPPVSFLRVANHVTICDDPRLNTGVAKVAKDTMTFATIFATSVAKASKNITEKD